VITDLGTLDQGKRSSTATSINERGEVVGRRDTAVWGVYHAFLWRNGKMTDLGTPRPPPYPGAPAGIAGQPPSFAFQV
jgi:probable HAF family extracellular repeat protein